ncbi:patatin-like phospholipase family protein [Undibacterium sp. RTI2.1]|uniref:patatin-like phospholipase family protein n=1 Tax=unclassified Undibacterium TaxID=2630295 RepID=UPI002AB577EC|nr:MULTISPECIES: patatin-like phospholipase family protein [unclassified Undibacterium]MDY7540117.1 patatin-like phospholipase family protein [Undibacterium sp. 5I1]MEB0031692.1 patatin-like phospholipase family protein [Undibacterium sp. RTI2.1]MEB0118056.1 patatin-like phospholipase family protein [Undibacterium sp. RTI2.2]MEB0233131.1 patatin-like phospholipase family protein [Undibacterium sp. 10I3]MEB0259219.1 patatin-like phospholipase family protein [Undibacterium sp. 5I1]
MTSPIQIRAGKFALEHIRQHGLQARDIAVIPAAAGGPKGLILQALDQWLFGEWLPSAPRERTLIGASIGAWRMAAASHADPVAAFQRLGDLYCEQRYPEKPSAQYVTDVCVELLQNFIGGYEQEIVHQPLHRLHLLAVRGRGFLSAPQSSGKAKAGFVAATFSNLASRSKLANHMDRMVIGDMRDPLFWLKAKFDAFDTHFSSLTADNLASALLASGTLPLIMEPVRHIPHAPTGTYWDGGIIDYHLALPYSRLSGNKEGGLVLYPHFTDHIVPGWLDKSLPWRRASIGKNRHWLDNVIMVSPSPGFLQTLPRGKVLDRKDFFFYGTNHDLRIHHWKTAMGEGARLRDAFADFIQRPDVSQVLPL